MAQEELAQLVRADHPLRDTGLTECLEAYGLLLERGVRLESGWQAWRLGLVPGRPAREVMGVEVNATADPTAAPRTHPG